MAGLKGRALLRSMRENTALHTELSVKDMENMSSEDWHNFRMDRNARDEEAIEI